MGIPGSDPTKKDHGLSASDVSRKANKLPRDEIRWNILGDVFARDQPEPLLMFPDVIWRRGVKRRAGIRKTEQLAKGGQLYL